ncbi:MAG: hypothetical protein IKA48_00200 [Fibrobacter sp.]|nr:hypothetical protein [Fibrobacter sp.]
MKDLYAILEAVDGMRPECAGALIEGYAAISGSPLMESIFSNFGSKLAKSLVTAAMVMGLMSTGASAAQKAKTPEVHKGKAVPAAVINKKTTRKGGVTKTVTRADLHNISLSDSYNKRVYDIILQMTQGNPNGNEQRMYEKACQQALQEVLDGKLKL